MLFEMSVDCSYTNRFGDNHMIGTRIKSYSFMAVLIAAGISAPLSPALSAMVPILDPSFEDEPTITVLPSAWDSYNPGGISVFYGTYPPTDTSDFYSASSPVSVPPDGTQVGYVYLSQDFGAGAVGFEQTLSSTLMANSRYDLSVAVGNLQTALSPRSNNFFDYEGFPGYGLQLLAGGEVIAEDLNSVPIAEGEFEEVSLSLLVGDTLSVSGPDLIGQALGIRLLNLNADLSAAFPPQFAPVGSNQNPDGQSSDVPVGWNSEVDFDNVQLSVSPVPVPAAFWLFATALVGFVGISRRRKIG